ncbi:AlpA family transcriptional regulator [Burkholderia cenocepacia]|nr:AlpA family transcriptional regulator [Burkholderia cenocepacia]
MTGLPVRAVSCFNVIHAGLVPKQQWEIGYASSVADRGSILRRRQVEREVGLKRSTIYQRMQEGTFPLLIRLGVRAVGWRASDTERFLEDPLGYRVPTSDVKLTNE